MIRDLDAQWSATAATHDVDKVVSYYSADAIVMAPNAASATTSEDRRKAWLNVASPTMTISWKANKVEMARSGEMAVVCGTYDGTSTDSKVPSDHGKYMELFKKQPNGDWKCTLDIWNSDMPAPAPGPKS
jgi:ketosteroid isomerase-like protein